MICQYKGANISEIRWDNASSNAPAGVAEIFNNFFFFNWKKSFAKYPTIQQTI